MSPKKCGFSDEEMHTTCSKLHDKARHAKDIKAIPDDRAASSEVGFGKQPTYRNFGLRLNVET